MKRFSFLNYLILVAIITVIFEVMYAFVEEKYRTAANDPQMQVASDLNAKPRQEKPVESFFADTIGITPGLPTFVVLYDGKRPIRSSGYPGERIPELPQHAFDFSKKESEHEVTWQPRNGVRMELIIH